MQEGEHSSGIWPAASHNLGSSPDLPKVLHALANKLLPIVAFSDLGIRSSQDPLALNYFEKIRHAAGDARDLIVSLRREIQEREGSLGFSAQEPSSGNVGFPSESTHSKTES